MSTWYEASLYKYFTISLKRYIIDSIRRGVFYPVQTERHKLIKGELTKHGRFRPKQASRKRWYHGSR